MSYNWLYLTDYKGLWQVIMRGVGPIAGGYQSFHDLLIGTHGSTRIRTVPYPLMFLIEHAGGIYMSRTYVLGHPPPRSDVLRTSGLANGLPLPFVSQPTLRIRRSRVKRLDRQFRYPLRSSTKILLDFRFRASRSSCVSLCRPGRIQNELRLHERHLPLGRL